MGFPTFVFLLHSKVDTLQLIFPNLKGTLRSGVGDAVEGGSRGRGYTYTYGRFVLLYGRN